MLHQEPNALTICRISVEADFVFVFLISHLPDQYKQGKPRKKPTSFASEATVNSTNAARETLERISLSDFFFRSVSSSSPTDAKTCEHVSSSVILCVEIKTGAGVLSSESSEDFLTVLENEEF